MRANMDAEIVVLQAVLANAKDEHQLKAGLTHAVELLEENAAGAEELRAALLALVLDCQNYDAWARPCHALNVAKAVLDKNPNPSGQQCAEASVHQTAEASGPVGLGKTTEGEGRISPNADGVVTDPSPDRPTPIVPLTGLRALERVADQAAHALDVWDERGLPQDQRTYVDGAFTEAMLTLRDLLADTPEPSNVVTCEERNDGVELAVWTGEEFSEFVASVNGPRSEALIEARRYAAPCLADGWAVLIEEVTRRTVETIAVTEANHEPV
jgi:hypothetical protein